MNNYRQSSLTFAFALALATLVVLSPAKLLAQPQVMGQWSPVFPTPNVMIHASLLPNGKILFWSRREAGETLDPHQCTPRLWDPSLGTGASAFSETANKPGYNLFCSGHTFLPDGRLFVVGGHLSDFHGSPQTTIYDPATNQWTAAANTKDGRWYPTAASLADGGVLVSFGGDKDGVLNTSQQVWKDGNWREIVNFNGPPLYPRMHLLSDARIFMSGPTALTQFLDTSGAGVWTPLGDRAGGFREYAPAVMYDVDKVVFIGGGDAPSATVETIDLSVSNARWKMTESMKFRRRQHNATLLPDGTVLVMGGTQGAGFDNLTTGQPIRAAELWDPKTGHWTRLGEAAVDRCYHSTAVLLPDATVLRRRRGGIPAEPWRTFATFGERPGSREPCGRYAQRCSDLFTALSFQGWREARYHQRPDRRRLRPDVQRGDFAPRSGRAGELASAFVRDPLFQCEPAPINFLKFNATAGTLDVTAPANAKLCPPGHYMLFVLDKNNVPSIAKIIKIQ